MFGAARASVTLSREKFSRSSRSRTDGKGKSCPVVQVQPNPTTIRQSRKYFLISPQMDGSCFVTEKSTCPVGMATKAAMRLRRNGYHGITWDSEERRGGGMEKSVVIYVTLRAQVGVRTFVVLEILEIGFR